MNQNSLRGSLIGLITKACIDEHLSEPIETFRKILQSQLDANLKFDTAVTHIQIPKNIDKIGIMFKDEFNRLREITLIVSS